MSGSGTTTLIISNKEMNDIMEIVKSLEESGLLIKRVSETIKNETKEQKGGFLSMSLGTLNTNLLGNLLTGKGTIRAQFLMPPYLLTIFERQKYYHNELKFNGIYSKNNLSKIKDGAYVINLDELKSMATHWIALYVNGNNIIHFDSFGVKHIPKEIK